MGYEAANKEIALDVNLEPNFATILNEGFLIFFFLIMKLI